VKGYGWSEPYPCGRNGWGWWARATWWSFQTGFLTRSSTR